MCKGKGMNVLVMDVEGTDGRERGEDQVCELLLDTEHHLTLSVGLRAQVRAVFVGFL